MKIEGAASNPRETRYLYEPSGLLLAVDMPGGQRIEYAYDSNGLRREKRIDGGLVEAFEWLDALRLREFFDGERWWRLVYDPARPGRTPIGVTDGEASFLISSDHLGTPRALADMDGNVVQTMRYDAFGNPLRGIRGVLRLPLGFAGGLLDADTGLTRFVWRDYDADTGRFTALDPMGAKGGDKDLYGYCVDDPVNRLDVWGLESKTAQNGSTGNEDGDSAKTAGTHIVGSGIKSGLWNAAMGYGAKAYGAERLAGAAVRGVLGLGTGMALATVLEYPPVKEKVEKAITWFEDNYKPTDDGTMQD